MIYLWWFIYLISVGDHPRLPCTKTECILPVFYWFWQYQISGYLITTVRNYYDDHIPVCGCIFIICKINIDLIPQSPALFIVCMERLIPVLSLHSRIALAPYYSYPSDYTFRLKIMRCDNTMKVLHNSMFLRLFHYVIPSFHVYCNCFDKNE